MIRPALVMFAEYDGEPDPSFVKYGNADALRALMETCLVRTQETDR